MKIRVPITEEKGRSEPGHFAASDTMAIEFIKLSPLLEAAMMGPFVQSQTLFYSPSQASHSLKFF